MYPTEVYRESRCLPIYNDGLISSKPERWCAQTHGCHLLYAIRLAWNYEDEFKNKASDVKSFVAVTFIHYVLLYRSLIHFHLEYLSEACSPYLDGDLQRLQRLATYVMTEFRGLFYEQPIQRLTLPTQKGFGEQTHLLASVQLCSSCGTWVEPPSWRLSWKQLRCENKVEPWWKLDHIAPFPGIIPLLLFASIKHNNWW